MLGNEWCKSHQGETSTAPAGGGRPASRTTCRKARASPPPDESPPTTMWPGWMGRCAAPGGGSIRKRSGGGTLAVCDGARRRVVARTRRQKVLQSAGEGVLRCKPVLRRYSASSCQHTDARTHWIKHLTKHASVHLARIALNHIPAYSRLGERAPRACPRARKRMAMAPYLSWSTLQK